MKLSSKLKWLDRTLIESPYHFGLCLSEKDFHKTLKRMNVAKDEWPSFMKTPQANATVHYFECDGSYSAIVCLGSTKGIQLEQVYAMFVHEAVHIWQAIKDHIGEDEPSKEFEAYSIQAISQRLMFAYKERKKK